MKRLIVLFLSITTFLSANPIFIGIGGGSGSGKSTLADRLIMALGPDAILVSEDSYYKDLSHLPFEKRNKTNFDHPDSIEFSLLAQHLQELRLGHSIKKPTYDFRIHSRSNQLVTVDPAPVVIVEGILLLAIPEIREQLDLKIFVDVDDDIRLLRRLERDMTERGRSFEMTRDQYLETVRPMYKAFVDPSKQYANIIVPIGGRNEKALEVILSRLKESLAEPTN
jgi:uridine kinase